MKERRRNFLQQAAILVGITAALLIILTSVSLYFFDGFIDAQIAKVDFENQGFPPFGGIAKFTL